MNKNKLYLGKFFFYTLLLFFPACGPEAQKPSETPTLEKVVQPQKDHKPSKTVSSDVIDKPSEPAQLTESLICPKTTPEESSQALTNFITKKGLEILKSPELTSSRKSFLELMKEEPATLAENLNRTQLSSVKIGSEFLSVPGNIGVCDKFILISKEIKKYLQNFSDINIDEKEDKIGKFSTAEIIFSMVYEFTASPPEKPDVGAEINSIVSDKSFIDSLKKTETKLEYSFVFMPKTRSLMISSNSEKSYTFKRFWKWEKVHVAISQVSFEIEKGHVSYYQKQSFDGKTDEWSSDTNIGS